MRLGIGFEKEELLSEINVGSALSSSSFNGSTGLGSNGFESLVNNEP